MNPKNLKQAKALVKKYKSITAKRLKFWTDTDGNELTSYGTYIMHDITGFGTAHSCTPSTYSSDLFDELFERIPD